eukprot:7386458-Prymnesium_polylepis.1
MVLHELPHWPPLELQAETAGGTAARAKGKRITEHVSEAQNTDQKIDGHDLEQHGDCFIFVSSLFSGSGFSRDTRHGGERRRRNPRVTSALVSPDRTLVTSPRPWVRVT